MQDIVDLQVIEGRFHGKASSDHASPSNLSRAAVRSSGSKSTTQQGRAAELRGPEDQSFDPAISRRRNAHEQLLVWLQMAASPSGTAI
ncbi:hypothetical protein [Rhodospirillaceae bacterium SYSU D60014]|uniref:hypothetical protein n=1 Tax=Virgifigura deserti TaxID=2268457 RepID=UPI0013C40D21